MERLLGSASGREHRERPVTLTIPPYSLAAPGRRGNPGRAARGAASRSRGRPIAPTSCASRRQRARPRERRVRGEAGRAARGRGSPRTTRRRTARSSTRPSSPGDEVVHLVAIARGLDGPHRRLRRALVRSAPLRLGAARASRAVRLRPLDRALPRVRARPREPLARGRRAPRVRRARGSDRGRARAA